MTTSIVTVVLDCGHTRTQRVPVDYSLYRKTDVVKCRYCDVPERVYSVLKKPEQI